MVGWIIGIWLGSIDAIFVCLLWLRAVRGERLRARHEGLHHDDHSLPELRTEGVEQ